MQRGQPNKKIRLEISNAGEQCNDDGLWGEDLNIDDEVMQQIESQALSQYQGVPGTCRNAVSQENTTGRIPLQPGNVNLNSHDNELFQERLQMKQGEVKNLRLENDKLRREFNNKLYVKDEIIESLKKQLSEKQSEIDFQKMEKLSQTCKTPKPIKLQQNITSPFHERFQFTQSKSLIKDGKVFNFGGQLNKGDMLYKLLHRAFNLNCNDDQKEKGNEFTLYLKCCLLQLCRFTSFEKSDSINLIEVVVSRSHDVLSNFLRTLTEKEVKQDLTGKKIKITSLPKCENDFDHSSERRLLLDNRKWFPKEKGVTTRQTVAMLAKLMEIEPLLICTMVKVNDFAKYGYDCDFVNAKPHECKTKTVYEMGENTSFDSFVCGCVPAFGEFTSHKLSEMIFSVSQLLDRIVREITIRKKSWKYEGVFCCVLYFFSALCTNSSRIMNEKYKTSIMNMIRRIIFSLPGFRVIQYVIDFLISSALHSLSDFLCHRSAAETFTENFRSYCFTEDTCILQVMCAQIEIMNKSPYFIYKFTSWIVEVTTQSHAIKWMQNETNSKLCECLPAVQQTTIRILLQSIEEMDNKNLSSFEKMLLKSCVRQCSRILRQFKWQNDRFVPNIANCIIEYEMLLRNLNEIADDENTKKFALKEMAVLQDDKNHHSLTAVNKELIKSVLEFSPFIDNDS